MNKRSILFTCCIWMMMVASAQEVNFTKHISSADGLSNDFVISMAIDGKGYVWVGTEAGVNRITGKTYRPFTSLHYPPMNGDKMVDITGLRITALYWYEEGGLLSSDKSGEELAISFSNCEGIDNKGYAL